MAYRALRLRAEDAEDLAVISACLQDALVELRHFDYAPDERRFAGVLVRFVQEEQGVPARQVKCALAFDRVVSAKLKGLTRTVRPRPLELLAITAGPAVDAGVHITLIFAGGGALRLEASSIACRLEDVGDPWLTRLRPRHGEDR
jgi:hypothetical protein